MNSSLLFDNTLQAAIADDDEPAVDIEPSEAAADMAGHNSSSST